MKDDNSQRDPSSKVSIPASRADFSGERERLLGPKHVGKEEETLKAQRMVSFFVGASWNQSMPIATPNPIVAVPTRQYCSSAPIDFSNSPS